MRLFKKGDRIRWVKHRALGGEFEMLVGKKGTVNMDQVEGSRSVIVIPDDKDLLPGGAYFRGWNPFPEWRSWDDMLELLPQEEMGVSSTFTFCDLLIYDPSPSACGGWDYLNTPRNGRM